MFDFEKQALNESFMQMLSDPSFLKEAQDKGAEYLTLQIYEDSFMERIWPNQPISPARCDRDVNSPNYRVVIDKEFRDVKATTFTFRGRAEFDYVETDRYAVEFFKIESDEYTITEGELRGIRQPLQNLIRNQVAYQIKKTMDSIFIGMCEAAVADSGQVLDLSATPGVGPNITPDILVQAFNLIDDSNAAGRAGQYLTAETMLMSRAQYNYVNTWIQTSSTGAVANGIGTEFWRDGFTYDRLFGRRVVKTIKDDIVPSNVVWLFTKPELIGHHFSLGDDRFYIEKKYDFMTWKGARSFGAAIGNNPAIAKVILPAA